MEKVARCLSEQDLLYFRIQPCVHKALKRDCPNGDDCFHSHCLSWCRRNPSEYGYSYHPAVYKTKLCRAWLSEHSCKRVFCPFAHGDNELRMRGAAPKFFTSSNQYPDFQAPVPWNITDEPNSQSSYSSTASSARSNYKPQTQHFHESFYDSVEGMQPLGGLVLGSDGHLYLRVIPTRN